VSSVAEPVSIVAGYQFVDVNDGPALRQRCLDAAQAAGIKGTLLIAPEGINFTLAGAPTAIAEWLQGLRSDPRFAGIEVKQHGAKGLPFGRLRVKLKNEIIRMNQPAVRPGARRAPTVTPASLARWLAQGHDDAGRPLVLLDTRNGFEVDAGAFVGALDWRLEKFSDFPAALQANQQQLEGKMVVSYCTGGIRCEKAALWMQQHGVEHVVQLEGGILRYLEALPDAPHWRGGCFVFDERGQIEPERR
jgi:UPF0176 protein